MPGTDFAFDNPNIWSEWRRQQVALEMKNSPEVTPAQVLSRIEDINGVNIMAEYRRGKEMACADVVICTIEGGTPKVLLSKRNKNEPFGGYWWVHGGSLGAYVDMREFITKRAERECGVRVEPQVLLGFYRTSAADAAQSTTQPCFAAKVDSQILSARMQTDPNHESVRLFTAEELSELPHHERHWYPMHVAQLTLENIHR